MRVLVTWGSKRGGTADIGRILGDALASRGFEVAARPVNDVEDLGTFNAVIIGGALYGNLWPREARRFVIRHMTQLRTVPVWLFSSGPLDSSADRADIPPTRQVAVLAERIGAKGHVTFGGRLERNAKGFPASAMAKTRGGDWRNPERIRTWAAMLATELTTAVPGTPVEHVARSRWRLVAHGVAGWALCAVTMTALLSVADPTTALIVHGLAAPVIFATIAWNYFRAHGARDPLPTALAWTAIVMLLDLVVVAGAVQRSLELFESVPGTWLPFALIFLATWSTGVVLSMMPEGMHRAGTTVSR
jgi:menaquinone-dependent protoporphyrinogen oxidase